MINKDWRPENWSAIKRQLELTPHIWGTAIPMVSHEEQIIEATATRILDEFLKLAKLEEKDGQTNKTDNNGQTIEPKDSV